MISIGYAAMPSQFPIFGEPLPDLNQSAAPHVLCWLVNPGSTGSTTLLVGMRFISNNPQLGFIGLNQCTVAYSSLHPYFGIHHSHFPMAYDFSMFFLGISYFPMVFPCFITHPASTRPSSAWRMWESTMVAGACRWESGEAATSRRRW